MSTTSYRCITPTPPRSPRQSPNFVYQLSLSIIGVFVWLVVGISSLLCVPSFLKRLCPDLYWAATQPVSSPCDYNEVKMAVLNSPAVLKAIGEEQANSSHQVKSLVEGKYTPTINYKRLKLATSMYDEMAGYPNELSVRILSYFLRKTWKWLYPYGIHVKKESVEPILEAAKSGPLLLTPTHKSHIDSLLVTYFCFEHSLPIPFVVADDSLNRFLVGRLMKSCGAFFLPRSFKDKKDKLGKILFQEYVSCLLLRNHSIECFIEGSRSRTGKVQQPKVGMLKRVVKWVMNNNQTVFVVPISLGYDRIVESDSHLEVLSGGGAGWKEGGWVYGGEKEGGDGDDAKKFATGMTSMGKTASLIMNVTCFGRVDLCIATPIDLGAFLQECMGSLYGSGGAVEKGGKFEGMTKKGMIKYLAMSVGYQALYLCNKVSIAEPAALVATVLLSQTKRGINRNELKSDVMWLKNLIMSHGGQVAPFSPEYIDVVLSLILEPIVGDNKLVKRHKDLLMVDLYSPEERMELSLYVNQIIHLFVEAGIISLVLYKQYKHHNEDYDSPQQHHDHESPANSPHTPDPHQQLRFIPVKNLIEDVFFLSSLLKLEFVFCPSSALQSTINSTLLLLEKLGTVEWGCSLGCQGKGCECEMGDNDKEEEKVGEGRRSCVRVCSSREAQETYLFYATIFWRFLDSYWLVALGFFYLLPERVMTESSFISRLQKTGENLYFEGQLDLFEAISRETLVNAVTLFIKWGVIEHLPIEGEGKGGGVELPGRRVLRLMPDYQSEEELEGLVAKIEEFRKSLKAYRSRRFLIRHTSETKDSIDVVKKEVEKWASPPPVRREGTKSPLPAPKSRKNHQQQKPPMPRNPSPMFQTDLESRQPTFSFSSPFIAIKPPKEHPPELSLSSPGGRTDRTEDLEDTGGSLISFLELQAEMDSS